MLRNRMNQGMLEKSIGRGGQDAPAVRHLGRLTYRRVETLENAGQLAASLTDNPKDRQELTAFFLEALGKYRVAAAISVACQAPAFNRRFYRGLLL
jgi:hypothetical protein